MNQKRDSFFSKLTHLLIGLVLTLFSSSGLANQKVLNVYTWAAYVPKIVIQQFEKETGIKLNITLFDSNETLYAKLKSAKFASYDIIMPSNYFIDRMRKENMLEKLDKSKLKHLDTLDARFHNSPYDPHNIYSLPYLWTSTGITVNTKRYPAGTITRWSDLWRPEFEQKVLLIDESRDIFSMVMIMLGYSVNETNPERIKIAYDKLLSLLPNVRLFNSMAIPNILIDEDVDIAVVWGGEAFFATSENPNLIYVYPEEGFTIEMDCMAIPKGALHREAAYRFMNFVMRSEVAKSITQHSGYISPNVEARKRLPKAMRDNPIINPSSSILKRGSFQTDIGKANALYSQYWERLKLKAMSL